MFTDPDATGSNNPHSAPVRPYLAEGFHPADAGPAGQEGDSSECEEVLVVDGRADVGPAQQVENKLGALLGGAPLPVSHVRLTGLPGNRTHC